MSMRLPKETPTQLASAQRNCFVQTARALRNGRIDCLECGGSWVERRPGKTILCPHCAKRLTVEFGTKKNFEQRSYFAILDVVNGYQVIRLYDIRAYQTVG